MGLALFLILQYIWKCTSLLIFVKHVNKEWNSLHYAYFKNVPRQSCYFAEKRTKRFSSLEVIAHLHKFASHSIFPLTSYYTLPVNWTIGKVLCWYGGITGQIILALLIMIFLSTSKETPSVWHSIYESWGKAPLHCLMLSCSNLICTLLQIWFCTCLSISGYVTISSFARAYVSAFTSFLPGQTSQNLSFMSISEIFLLVCTTVLQHQTFQENGSFKFQSY